VSVIASFNSVQSDAALVTGVIVALGIAAGVIWYCRPLMAAAIGALSWGAIGYLVGVAGTGEMTSLSATAFGLIGMLVGALVMGVGATVGYYWSRSKDGRCQ